MLIENRFFKYYIYIINIILPNAIDINYSLHDGSIHTRYLLLVISVSHLNTKFTTPTSLPTLELGIYVHL